MHSSGPAPSSIVFRSIAGAPCCAALAFAASVSGQRAEHSTPQQITLPGSPFAVEASPDGRYVFISLSGASNGIAVVQRQLRESKLLHVLPFTGSVSGLAITRDARLLLATVQPGGLAVIDARKAVAAASDAVLGYVSTGEGTGPVQVALSQDERLAFVSNERTASISVIDLETALDSDFTQDALIGNIPVETLPVGALLERVPLFAAVGLRRGRSGARSCSAAPRPELRAPRCTRATAQSRAKRGAVHTALARSVLGCPHGVQQGVFMVRFAKILITVFSMLAITSIVIRVVRAESAPETLIYAKYDDEMAGQQALDALKAAEHEGAIKLESYAIVVKEESGKTKVKDERKKSTAAGAGIGAVVGLLGGPVGAVIGAGVGGAAGYLRGKHVGMPKEMVENIEASLKPGNSAIVALVQEKWLVPTTKAIERTQAREVLNHRIASVDETH